MQYRNRTILILGSTTVVTIGLWLISVPDLPDYARGPWHYISQITANLTLVYMGISLVMSMRMHVLEKIFGGLDKNYKIHALVGSLAFVFMIMHPITLAADEFLTNLDNLPLAIQEASYYLFPRDVLRANLGIAAVYIVLFAFTFMTYLKVQYHHWLNTHRLLGVAFLLAGLHAYLAPSDIFRSPLLTTWLSFWIFAGLSASIYSIILYRRFGPRYKYVVDRIEKLGDIYNLVLTPVKGKILFVPGQFMYIRFQNKKLGTEMHPFSASNGPDENELRFSIKELGDFTNVMDDVLVKGESAEVYGPYGNFGKTYMFDKGPMVWIAGGIGVTPFLSMLHAENRKPTNRKIIFYYSLNKPAEAIFDKEIIKLIQNLPHITYIKWIAEKSGFLTAEKILLELKSHTYKAHKTSYLLCGPPGMMRAMQTQLKVNDIREDRIIFEEFSFVS